MAVNEIQSGGYNGLLHKLLSMREGAPAPTLGAEMLSAIVLEQERPDWEFLKGARAFGLVGQVLAAGTQSSIQLINPAGSGVIGIIFKANALGDEATGGTQRVMFSIGLGLPTGPVSTFAPAPRDSRAATPGSVSGVLFAQDAPNSTGLFVFQHDMIRSDAGATAKLLLPVVLAPGSRMGIGFGTAVATQLFASFEYIERIVEPSELR